MKLIEIVKVEESYHVSLTRDEVLTIVAIAGYIGGNSAERRTFEDMSTELGAILDLEGDTWRTALKELGLTAEGSIYLNKSEGQDDDKEKG